MDGGDLKPGQVTPLLASKDAVLRKTAEWVVSHHAQWGSDLAGFFRARLSASTLTASVPVSLHLTATGFPVPSFSLQAGQLPPAQG